MLHRMSSATKTNLTLADIAKEMRSMDIAMLMTQTDDGRILGRLLRNNQDAEYVGDSYYFAWGYSPVVQDIERHPQVALTFHNEPSAPAKPLRINVEGRAEVIRDADAIHEHWSHRLDNWYDRGPDTPGLVMIKVRAHRVHYWNGAREGEIVLD
jgi:general stress protein 26